MSALDVLRAIAEEIHQLRSDWDLGGILTVLNSTRDRGTIDNLRNAALKAARDPDSRTPASITFDRHWNATGPKETTEPHKFTGPLTECRACGQPADRSASERLKFCRACLAPWDPVVHQSAQSARRPTIECPNCTHRQAVGFRGCGQCGAVLPDPNTAHVAAAARAAAARAHHEDPMVFGEVLADLDLHPPEETR